MSWPLARQKGTNGSCRGLSGTVESRARTRDALDARTATPPMGSTVSTPAPPDPEGASVIPRPASHVEKTHGVSPGAAQQASTYPSHALTPPPAHSPSSGRVPARRPAAAERHVRAPRPRRAVAARQRDREVRASAPRRRGHPEKRVRHSPRRLGVVVGGVVSRRPRDGGGAVPAVVGDGHDADQGPATRAAVLADGVMRTTPRQPRRRACYCNYHAVLVKL